MIMKKIFLILTLLGFLNVKAQIQKAELVATGLTCSMCSNSIYKKLTAINGVDSVQIDLNANLFTIYLNKNQTLTPNDFKEAVEKAGFFIGSLVLYMPKENVNDIYGSVLITKNATFRILKQEKEIKQNLLKVKVINKGYVTAKEYKKMASKKEQFLAILNSDQEEYHVKLLN